MERLRQLRRMLSTQIEAASGQERTAFEEKVRELLQKADFSGRDFNQFTNLMIELLGGTKENGYLQSNYLVEDRVINFERVRSGRCDYAEIEICSRPTGLSNRARILRPKEISWDEDESSITDVVSFGERGFRDNGVENPICFLSIDASSNTELDIEPPLHHSFMITKNPTIIGNECRVSFEPSIDEVKDLCARIFAIYEEVQTQQTT